MRATSAASARCTCSSNHAISGLRQPCADAVSVAVAMTAGLAFPVCNKTPAATRRERGSEMPAKLAALPAVATARCAGGNRAT